MANIEEKVENLLGGIIQDLGYELYDVIYEKEANDYYLRIFIDKPEGIDLNDCEKVNNAITDKLDEADYIKEQYFLEVSSPGLERILRKEKHLETNLGKEVVLHLFKPICIEVQEGKNNLEELTDKKQEKKKEKSKKKDKKGANQKQIEGILKGFEENQLILEIKNQEITIQRKDIAVIKLKYNWDK